SPIGCRCASRRSCTNTSGERRRAGSDEKADARSHRHRCPFPRFGEDLRGPRPAGRSCRDGRVAGRADCVSVGRRFESRAARAPLRRFADRSIRGQTRRRHPPHLPAGLESRGASRATEGKRVSPDQRRSGTRRAWLSGRLPASVGRKRGSDRVEREGMIEGFEPSSRIILNLVNPREKFFGVLGALSPAGITVRAINLDSFEDWLRQIAHEEEANLGLLKMFVPLFRVGSIFLDEPTGEIKSYLQRFEEVVGMPIREYLGL